MCFVFLCFDEFVFKVVFYIIVVYDVGYKVLFNMLLELCDRRNDGFLKSCFLLSVFMLIYFVVFIVCDFEYKEINIKSNKKVVWMIV